MWDEDYKEAVSQFLNSVDRELNAFLHARKAEEYEPAVQLIINAQDRGNRLHITGIGKPGHVSTYMASLAIAQKPFEAERWHPIIIVIYISPLSRPASPLRAAGHNITPAVKSL